jgi:hypothetical protein
MATSGTDGLIEPAHGDRRRSGRRPRLEPGGRPGAVGRRTLDPGANPDGTVERRPADDPAAGAPWSTSTARPAPSRSRRQDGGRACCAPRLRPDHLRGRGRAPTVAPDRGAMRSGAGDVGHDQLPTVGPSLPSAVTGRSSSRDLDTGGRPPGRGSSHSYPAVLHRRAGLASARTACSSTSRPPTASPG